MFQNNISHAFLVMIYCLLAINKYHVVASDGSLRSVLMDRHHYAPQLDCSEYSNDLDVLRQLPFPVQLNLSMDGYYSFQNSAAQVSEDGISIERIIIKNEKLFPSSLFCLSNLSILHIESTPFLDDTIPDTIANLKTLKYLIVFFVPIKKITTELGNLVNLEVVTFSHCSLTHLPNLNNLPHLKTLNLPSNSLTGIDELSNSFLDILDLSFNNITEIPMLKHKEHLMFMFLNNNPLESAASIVLYPNLQNVQLSDAKLTSIPSSISKLEKLDVLTVNNNQLTDLPVGILNLSKLVLLNVQNNLFSLEDIQSIQETFKQFRPTTLLFA